MTKARKAPQKKIQRTQNRGLKLASALFVALGVLVVLSMIFSSVFTQPPAPIVPITAAAPTVIPTP